MTQKFTPFTYWKMADAARFESPDGLETMILTSSDRFGHNHLQTNQR